MGSMSSCIGKIMKTSENMSKWIPSLVKLIASMLFIGCAREGEGSQKVSYLVVTYRPIGTRH